MKHPDHPDKLEASCPDHGLIALGGSRDKVLQQVAGHFLYNHRRAPHPLVEGEHFTITAMSLRCDLCGSLVEPPWWDHVTEPRLAEFGDADGKWLICDSCHELIGKERALRQRIIVKHRQNFSADDTGLVAHVTPLVARFCAAVDAGVRAPLRPPV